MRRNKFARLCLLCGLVSVAIPFAALGESEELIPAADRARAQQLGVHGPTENSGVESVEVLGMLPLAEDFPALADYAMRARRIALSPGGVVGVHQHAHRPGALYVLEGTMTEVRSGSEAPLLWKAGTATFESHGTIHWWRNDGATRAVAFVVDIVPLATE